MSPDSLSPQTSVAEFLESLASEAPTPGGGGAAALALLTAAALGDATGLAEVSVLRTVLLTLAVLTSYAAVLWMTRSTQVRAAWAVVRDAS